MLSNKKRKIGQMQNGSQYNDSVVKIESTDLSPNYEMLWKGANQLKYTGAGSVIDAANGLILTCGHVSNPRNLTTVRLGSDAKKYQAKVLVCEMDCDMAILQVTDPEFRKKAKAVQFGNFQALGSHVTAVGYPMQSNELTATAGMVASNEVQRYVSGDAQNLVSMITAAVNPGNSGGPVFSDDGLQVGVAFQADDPSEAESVGFMVPAQVVKHFIQMAYAAIAERKNITRGFPQLPVSIQYMQNPELRAFYGMRPDQTGIRIKKIDTLAKNQGLEEDDILLAIDGKRIQNDGTFNDYKDISERLYFTYLITEKTVGDTVNLKVLRNGKELDIPFALKYRANDLKLVGRLEVKRDPCFYVKNSMSFQPVTPNYLTSERGKGLLLVQDKDSSILSAAKTTMDQQAIVINTVFDTEFSEGYGDVGRTDLVDMVNGVKINNMCDLVTAMESQTSGRIMIDLKNKKKIVMNVPTAEQEAEIAAMHDIPKTHSDDLTAIIESVRAKQTGGSSLLSHQYMQQPPQRQLQQQPVNQQQQKATI